MRRIAAALATALLAALLCAPAAPAASRLVIKGHGYGHGIGMSQYGALGFAQHGSSYKDILTHYYEQTQVIPLASKPDVRVLLQSGRRAVVSGAVAASGGKKLNPTAAYVARSAGGGRISLFNAAGHKVVTADAPLRLAAAGDGALTLRGAAANGTRNGRYRGALEIRPSGSGVMAVNDVGLEDYVRGVVSAESPATWPAEALKAQAVAARTYAVTTNVGTPTDGIDQYADTRSQMYKGVAAEFPATDAAVAATSGEVVAMGGKPVVTYFFSTSGGHTENVEFSFVGSLPRTWLRGVDDPFDGVSPKHTWGPFAFTQAKAQSKLHGLVRGKFRGITVTQRGTSPRVVRAEINGTHGVTPVTGPQLRSRFGLFDTWATFTYISTEAKKPKSDAGGDTGSGSSPAGTTDPSGGTTPPPATNTTDTTGGQAASVARMRPAVLTGSIQPVKRGRRLDVQRRDDGRWRTVGRTTVGRGGGYRATLPGPGRYRVAWSDIAGPAVDVR